MSALCVEAVIQLALGLMFAVAALAKARAPRAFILGVASQGVIPSQLAPAVAGAVIVAELYFAVAHLTGWSLRLAAAGGAATVATFAIVTAIQLSTGRKVPCLCFDSSDREVISGTTLLRQALVVVGELVMLEYSYGPAGIIHGRRVHPAPLGVWLATFAGSVVLLSGIRWILALRMVRELVVLRRERRWVVE